MLRARAVRARGMRLERKSAGTVGNSGPLEEVQGGARIGDLRVEGISGRWSRVERVELSWPSSRFQRIIEAEVRLE